MRFLSVLSVLASASVSVLAQETTTSTGTSTPKNGGSSCDAQNILDACVESIQEQVDACGPNEWDCLCEQTNNMLTTESRCYNNCPNDGSRTGIQQQRISYCNAAGTLSTSSTRPATKTATATSDASSTSDGAAASATADDAASRLEIGLGAGFGVGLAVLGGLV